MPVAGDAPRANADPLTLFLNSPAQVLPPFSTWLAAAAVSYDPDAGGCTILLPGEDEPLTAAAPPACRAAAAAPTGTTGEKEAVAGVAILQQRLGWAAYATAPAAWRRFRACAPW